jgi:hypothetical protein
MMELTLPPDTVSGMSYPVNPMGIRWRADVGGNEEAIDEAADVDAAEDETNGERDLPARLRYFHGFSGKWPEGSRLFIGSPNTYA